MLRTCLTLTLVAGLALPAFAQTRSRTGRSDADWCAQNGDSDRASHCEVRELTIGGANPIEIDAGRNGGITVRGWDRGDALVRARIVGYGDTEADAQRVTSAVRIDGAGGVVRAEGPTSDDRQSWHVSFEVSVPRTAILTLTANNGGIVIEDFRGTAKFQTRNGGINLRDVGGDIRGETTNGGVNVDVSGDHWDGAGLDVTTHNGGVNIRLPEHYSAELEVGTTHGRLNVNIPITVQGTIGRTLTTTLGAGGAKLRAMTTNGGVSIRQR
jgi:Putative adhesin